MSTVPGRPAPRGPAGKSSAWPATTPAANPPVPAASNCSHPRVQIVSREEDAEFVECLECREIFEASEFRDMAIEEKIKPED